jgi:regulator of replication initiation timing
MADPTDAVARTKADPNRSRREDQLVAEIERLRTENAHLRESLSKRGDEHGERRDQTVPPAT